MVHIFKIYGQNYAIDENSRAVHKITALQADMLRYLKFPLADALPSDLRYDLARYESQALKNGYIAIKKLYEDGVFSADEGITAQNSDATGYEMKAKAIIRYNMGRSEILPDDVPEFDLTFELDERGYTYICIDDLKSVLSNETQKKIIECAVAVHFSKKDV